MDELSYMAQRLQHLLFAVTLAGKSEAEFPMRVCSAISTLCMHARQVTPHPDPNLSRLGELCRVLSIAPPFERQVFRPWLALRSSRVSGRSTSPFAREWARWEDSELDRLTPLVQDYRQQVRKLVSAESPMASMAPPDPLRFLTARLRRFHQHWSKSIAACPSGLPAEVSDVPRPVRVRPGRAARRAARWEQQSRIASPGVGFDPEAVLEPARLTVDPQALYALWCALRFSDRTGFGRHGSVGVGFRARRSVAETGLPSYFDVVGDDVPLAFGIDGMRSAVPDFLLFRHLPRERRAGESFAPHRAWVTTWFAPASGDALDHAGLAAAASACAATGVHRIVFCVRDTRVLCERWGWKAAESGVALGSVGIGPHRIPAAVCALVPKPEAEPRNDQVMDRVFALMQAP